MCANLVRANEINLHTFTKRTAFVSSLTEMKKKIEVASEKFIIIFH
jgi:hypothetical protein